MFDQFKDLRSLSLASGGEEFGAVEDIYFDDHTWKVRYVVAEVGGWFDGRQALISAHLCGRPDLLRRTLPVALTREEAEAAPPATSNPPVSEQRAGLTLSEALPPFLVSSPDVGMSPILAEAQLAALTRSADASGSVKEGNPNLRSAGEVVGYGIHATDGNIGSVADLLMDPATWDVSYLVIDTGSWLTDRKVIVSPTWTEMISWQDREIRVKMTKAEVEASPRIESLPNLDGDALDQLHSHYGYVAT